jgi:uncharacterized protein YndB with AHSA1/START domain
MSNYRFLTHWRFEASSQRVWEVLTDMEKLPLWWESFEKAIPRNPDRQAEPGGIMDCVVRGSRFYALRFSLEIVEWNAPVCLKLRAKGDLEGIGEWRLSERNGATEVDYLWEVRLTRPLLAWLGRWRPVRRYLENNHERVMRQGDERLKTLMKSANHHLIPHI